MFPALLEIRNKNEAERFERELREKRKAEGMEDDGEEVHIKPGQVDWLYGLKQPEDIEKESGEEDKVC